MPNPFKLGAGGRGQADAAQAQGGCGGGVIKITISMGSEIIISRPAISRGCSKVSGDDDAGQANILPPFSG